MQDYTPVYTANALRKLGLQRTGLRCDSAMFPG